MPDGKKLLAKSGKRAKNKRPKELRSGIHVSDNHYLGFALPLRVLIAHVFEDVEPFGCPVGEKAVDCVTLVIEKLEYRCEFR